MKNSVDKKDKKFIRGSIPWFLLGFCFAIIMIIFKEFNIKLDIKQILDIVSYISGILGIIFLIIAIILIVKCKNKMNTVNEEELDILNERLDFATIYSGISMILTFLSGGIMFYGSENMGVGTFKFICLIIFTILCFTDSYVQFKIVNSIKKINPEKRGDPLNLNFSKEWYGSSDEAQRKIVGEACYKTFTLTNLIFTFAFIILIFVGTVVNIGISCIITIGLVNLINMIVYSVMCIKIEYKRD